ncbi:right-handed parallel beta-helix repeat-containing protein [Sphingomonas baiyangensis]|uniref:Right-handed parallel beta-helix repeat-containing protein n=1 Tax=Sphingomonas baiyangensis TaxID=2572576 RepID=A0A4U1L4N7_9SPHN|nr:right-handed parallel beta-helix repeat-containing protein [Sphingomonas baiyangensis]TKD51146.1 right-handed parallel beta-helix repeat-containing protein [Sphingomonas baiyangensis]
MRPAMRPILALAAAGLLASPALPQSGGPFTIVESGQVFASLYDAVQAIGNSTATIRIAPGRYRECVVQEAGAISYVSETPGAVVFDGAICEDKATFVLRGRAAAVDGIVFTRTFVPDGNGAGIRIEQGDLTVSNSMFVDGQCGILSAADPNASIAIDKSTFARLGKHPDGSGAHALYIGEYGSLKVTRSRFEQGTGGHYIKNRAPRVEIVDNSFDDSKGQATNYMIDLSNGATGRIALNSFVQGTGKDNWTSMITVAPEGAENRSGGLAIEANRAWTVPDFEHETAFVRDWSGEKLVLRDNEVAKNMVEFARQ